MHVETCGRHGRTLFRKRPAPALLANLCLCPIAVVGAPQASAALAAALRRLQGRRALTPGRRRSRRPPWRGSGMLAPTGQLRRALHPQHPHDPGRARGRQAVPARKSHDRLRTLRRRVARRAPGWHRARAAVAAGQRRIAERGACAPARAHLRQRIVRVLCLCGH